MLPTIMTEYAWSSSTISSILCNGRC